MKRKNKFDNPDGIYFVTLAIRNWTNTFTLEEYKSIMVNKLAYAQKHEGLRIFAWCILISHVHLIAKANKGRWLPSILCNIKKRTSEGIIESVKKDKGKSKKKWLTKKFNIDIGYRFWETGYHPIEIRSNAEMEHFLNNIHRLPVDEGLVYKPEEYEYSSAIDYIGGNGRLELEWIN